MDEQAFLRKLKAKHQDNLQQLKLQEAGYGARPPLELTNHISDIENIIKETNQRLASVQADETTLPSKEQDREFGSDTFKIVLLIISLLALGATCYSFIQSSRINNENINLNSQIYRLQQTAAAYENSLSKTVNTKVDIISLHPGSAIDLNTPLINGTFTGLPPSYKIWLYVIAGERYFPHSVDVFPNGTWSVENVTVGDIDEAGDEFKIGVFIADVEADRLLKKGLNGVYYLPPGVTVLNEIPVVRK